MDYLNYGTEDFVLDNDFLNWVQHPDSVSDQYWADLQEKYPELKGPVNEAILIIRSFMAEEPAIPAHRLDLVRERIGKGSTPPRRYRYLLLRIAAVLTLLLVLSGLIYHFLNRQPEIRFETVSQEVKEKGKLILADGTVREFESELTRIEQTSAGQLTLNNDTLSEDLSAVKSGEITMNQVIIPYGQRSEVRLADGTRIWLNSGSQLWYPSVFQNNSREIYLSGEAFFDVASDKTRPFTVITGDMKMRVLGTKFNVCTYMNDPSTQVVLVEGRISAGRNKPFPKWQELVPGERITFDKATGVVTTDKVDVELHSSWVNGYLVFRNEPVSGIFRKLERYYNQQIVVEQNVDNVTFSGKLDLIGNLEVVLENISFTSSFTVTLENKIYHIKI